MTFREAVRLKGKRPASFTEKGITFKVFVTPENIDDLERYLIDIRSFFYKLKDRDAKKYSRNRQYLLRGLYYNKEGPEIEFKQIYD
jgi:hypothetical protein